jgi:hypothetical protein
MLLYVLICLCLALTGIAGLQMTYMFYLDRIDKERKKRLHELEHQCKVLSARLKEAQAQIEEQGELLKGFYEEYEDDELWADVIEDR